MEKVPIHIEKRIFDVVVTLFLIIILSPFILLVILGMLLESVFIPSSQGSIFYTEIRVSQGRHFKFYKFRIFKEKFLKETLREKGWIATKDLEETKGSMTFTGKVLKQIYMDELPQVINVLKGDMSLVGPRPTNIPTYEKNLREGKFSRFLIRAGITGYFQAHKGSELWANQNQLDMGYIEFCRNNPGWKVVLYDAKILLITVLAVLRAEGL